MCARVNGKEVTAENEKGVLSKPFLGKIHLLNEAEMARAENSRVPDPSLSSRCRNQ